MPSEAEHVKATSNLQGWQISGKEVAVIALPLKDFRIRPSKTEILEYISVLKIQSKIC